MITARPAPSFDRTPFVLPSFVEKKIESAFVWNSSENMPDTKNPMISANSRIKVDIC